MRQIPEGTAMKRIWIVLLAVAVALAIVLPAGAKKPDKPDKPNTGFQPMACEVDDAFSHAFVKDYRSTGGEDVDGELFTLDVDEPGVFWVTRYTVKPPPELIDVLCVEVTLDEGTLSDLRVRWLDCEECGLFRATGKDLRNFNNNDDEVFSAGVSVTDWADLTEGVTVAVMPKAKTDTATVTVRIGIDHP